MIVDVIVTMDRRQRPPRRTGRLAAAPLMAVEYRPRFYSDPRPWQLTNVPPGIGARYATNEVEEN
jgi:hypothetical protein